MWSVDPGIDGFARRADHEGSCHIGSNPPGNDGVPESPVRDHLGTGSHQFHECWSGMFPGPAVGENRGSAPDSDLADMADMMRWQWSALEGAQVGEEGTSPHCMNTGCVLDSGPDWVEQFGLDSLRSFGLAMRCRLKHSQAGMRTTCSVEADIGTGLRKSELGVAGMLKCYHLGKAGMILMFAVADSAFATVHMNWMSGLVEAGMSEC